MAVAADDLFEWGPPRRLAALARLHTPICPGALSRALLAIVLGWAPLAVLVAAAPDLAPPGALDSFLRDVGVHSRSAIAAPLLVLAHVVCARRLGVIARHFFASGLLEDEDKPKLEAALEQVRRGVNSLWAEVATICLAYAVVLSLLVLAPSALRVAPWQASPNGASLSPAGWWQVLVSAPLLLALLLGWVWRIAMWTRFLWHASRLDLRLIAAHPDQAGGLGFLCQSVRAFGVVGMGLGAVTAGRFANAHLAGTATQFTDGLLVGSTAILTVALSVGPLLVFTPPMMRAWRTSAMSYGALATELGGQFEHTWFGRPRPPIREMLSRPDFSATVDLYGVVSNVYAMRFVPVDVRSLIIVLAAALSPFIMAMFLSMPTEVVVKELKGLLF